MDKSTLKIIQDSLDDTAFILGLNLDECNSFTVGSRTLLTTVSKKNI